MFPSLAPIIQEFESPEVGVGHDIDERKCPGSIEEGPFHITAFALEL
jgi:hypothetical protein